MRKDRAQATGRLGNLPPRIVSLQALKLESSTILGLYRVNACLGQLALSHWGCGGFGGGWWGGLA